jgi:hypothetical protein
VLPKLTKRESLRAAKLARRLRILLDHLADKYYDEDDFGLSADFYAKDYNELQRASEAIHRWTL